MLKREWKDYKILLRSIPSPIVTIFVVSVIVMNLLANKELFSVPFLALDCGFSVSWVSFLCMDIICKRFGGKAAVKISILALGLNLCVSVLFKLLTLTPGLWGAYYTYQLPQVNDALNATIGGSWYVVVGSSLAMLSSAVVNSLVNTAIGNRLPENGFRSFAMRSYVSTGVAQFVDNMVFALLVSHVFFGWTMLQVFVCSLTGAAAELLCEIFLSPLGYRVVQSWERDRVGESYLAYIRKEKAS